MIHRNTFIATRHRLLGDDQSCKVIDAPRPGSGRDHPAAAGRRGTFWKWMALEDACCSRRGEQEQRDPNIRMRSEKHGWPWDPLSPGSTRREPVGPGNHLVAIDPPPRASFGRPRDRSVRQPCDLHEERRLFLFRTGVSRLSGDEDRPRAMAKTKANASEIMEALGSDLPRQDWRTNWRPPPTFGAATTPSTFPARPSTSCSRCRQPTATCSGRTLQQLSARPAGDGLYALSGQIDTELSRKFDPLTGRVLAEIKLGRRLARGRPGRRTPSSAARTGDPPGWTWPARKPSSSPRCVPSARMESRSQAVCSIGGPVCATAT